MIWNRYIYVIRTGFGVTKVGKTNKPLRRLKEHKYDHGKAVRYLMLPVLSMSYSERWLKRLARLFCGKPIRGYEFFRQYFLSRIVFSFFVLVRWFLPIFIISLVAIFIKNR